MSEHTSSDYLASVRVTLDDAKPTMLAVAFGLVVGMILGLVIHAKVSAARNETRIRQ